LVAALPVLVRAAFGDPAVEVAAAKVAAKLGQQGACLGRLSDPSGIRGNSTVRPLFFSFDRVKTMGTTDKLETVDST